MSGEAIYRGYDRAALDAQYNNRARIPEYVDYFDRWLAWSAETRAALPGARDVGLRRSAGRDPRHLPGGAARSADPDHDPRRLLVFARQASRQFRGRGLPSPRGGDRRDQLRPRPRLPNGRDCAPEPCRCRLGLAQCRLLRRRSVPHPRAWPVSRRAPRRHAAGDRLARLRCRFACRPRQERGFDLGYLRPGAHSALLPQRQGRYGRGGGASEQPRCTALSGARAAHVGLRRYRVR